MVRALVSLRGFLVSLAIVAFLMFAPAGFASAAPANSTEPVTNSTALPTNSTTPANATQAAQPAPPNAMSFDFEAAAVATFVLVLLGLAAGLVLLARYATAPEGQVS